MIERKKTSIVSAGQGWLALSPLIFFLCLYLVTSLVIGDFYKVPITVAFLLSAVYAVAIYRQGGKMRHRIDAFSAGAADSNIMLMIWIFILAGAFAFSAKEAGCIESTVNMVLQWLPSRLVPAGLFLGACFISLSVGTSVGTVVALVPVAAGIAEVSGMNLPFAVAIVVGGAFFGDNLSFISDTTIAATRTQGCRMQDKFWANLRIVLPAAVIAMALYLVLGLEGDVSAIEIGEVNYLKVLPYVVVLVGALAGINVSVVLVLGIVTVLIVDLCCGTADVFGWFGSMGQGIAGMADLIIVTLLAGGLLELIRRQGGINYLLQALTKRVSGRRGAALSIAALVSVANVCTANNTIAIITVGGLSADISKRFGLDPRRVASLLDTFSCVVQGILPYGAQMLMAASLSGVSPLEIIGYLYYPMVLAVCALLSIVFMPSIKASKANKGQ